VKEAFYATDLHLNRRGFFFFSGDILETLIHSLSSKDKESNHLPILGQACEATLVPHTALLCLVNGWWKIRNFSPGPGPDEMSYRPGRPLYIHAEQDLAVSFVVLKWHPNGK